MIRLYQESDLESIIELLNILAASHEVEKFEVCLFDVDTYKELYLIKKSYKMFIVTEDKEIAGFILGEHYCNDVFGILMLYVKPASRRKQYALGLKNAIAEFAKENGYKIIVSQVRTNNPESIIMNARAGWKIKADRIYPDYYVECSKEF